MLVMFAGPEFLPVSRVLVAARLSRRDGAWHTAEILLLQHQVTVLLRPVGPGALPAEVLLGRPGADRAAALADARARRARMSLIVTPGTILRWRRDLLRGSWARTSKPRGRPSTRRNIRVLVLRMAREDNERGYRRKEVAVLRRANPKPKTAWSPDSSR